MRQKTKKRRFIMRGCSKKGGSSKYNGTYNQNPVYPYSGVKGPFPGWLNPSINQTGGGCGCGGNMKMTGGSCDACTRTMSGGRRKHKRQRGGDNGLPYGKFLPPMKAPIVSNGLTGKAWGADFKWPGTDLVQGNFNHFSLNKYIPDVVTMIKNVGANFPFKGGGRKRSEKRRGRAKARARTMKKSRQRAGGNTFASDVVNGVRQINYNNSVFLNNLAGKNVKPMDPSVTYQPYLTK
jgi:hypothetical protein